MPAARLLRPGVCSANTSEKGVFAELPDSSAPPAASAASPSTGAAVSDGPSEKPTDRGLNADTLGGSGSGAASSNLTSPKRTRGGDGVSEGSGWCAR